MVPGLAAKFSRKLTADCHYFRAKRLLSDELLRTMILLAPALSQPHRILVVDPARRDPGSCR